MEITREVAIVTAEESDQCTVTLAIGTTSIDLTPGEAIRAGFDLIELGDAARQHQAEQDALDVQRVAEQPAYGFDRPPAHAILKQNGLFWCSCGQPGVVGWVYPNDADLHLALVGAL